ncbi:MAG: 50S ribosomal protein L11 methyltransferase, partial [Bacteroidales bacterium]|nr:50S ribosomal protein L11 methyltransferase [Bacteroidales bacterium]
IEIIIEPKMSFGTAHHETTSLMVEALLEEDLTGKAVLDMGCGTGVLAILASRMGAGKVVAIDVDERAVENARENFEKNHATDGIVVQGDDSAIPEEQFDVILANINLNTLIKQMPAYAGALGAGGILFLSGFYLEDLTVIEECAARLNLGRSGIRKKNNWIVAKFVR